LVWSHHIVKHPIYKIGIYYPRIVVRIVISQRNTSGGGKQGGTCEGGHSSIPLPEKIFWEHPNAPPPKSRNLQSRKVGWVLETTSLVRIYNNIRQVIPQVIS